MTKAWGPHGACRRGETGSAPIEWHTIASQMKSAFSYCHASIPHAEDDDCFCQLRYPELLATQTMSAHRLDLNGEFGRDTVLTTIRSALLLFAISGDLRQSPELAIQRSTTAVRLVALYYG